MNVPKDLQYTEDHEWIRIKDGVGRVGITDFAQDQLGDVVYVELPAVGASLTAGGTFGVVESVKSMSDLYAPVEGEVTAVNQALVDRPELVNSDPYGEGWMIEIKLKSPAPEGLLTSAQYEKLTEAAG